MALIVGIIFTLLTIAARLVPHIPNIAPVAALALFAGVYLPKKWSIILPVLAMLVSDIFIGFYQWEVMVAVYVGFILTVLIGWQVRKGVNPGTVLGGSLGGSVIFFLLTNAAVWLFTQMYAHTLPGLLDSYVMALPFFKFSILGDLAWTAVFFTAYQAAIARFPKINLEKLSTVDSVSPNGIH